MHKYEWILKTLSKAFAFFSVSCKIVFHGNAHLLSREEERTTFHELCCKNTEKLMRKLITFMHAHENSMNYEGKSFLFLGVKWNFNNNLLEECAIFQMYAYDVTFLINSLFVFFRSCSAHKFLNFTIPKFPNVSSSSSLYFIAQLSLHLHMWIESRIYVLHSQLCQSCVRHSPLKCIEH